MKLWRVLTYLPKKDLLAGVWSLCLNWWSVDGKETMVENSSLGTLHLCLSTTDEPNRADDDC